MTKSDLAREAVEKFPHSSKKELGKMLFKLHPLKFKDEESARYIVRAITGAAKKNKPGGISVTHKDIYKGLPKGRHNDFSPHILPPGKYGIMSDVHIPAHDDLAVGVALEHFYKQGVKHLVLNGDILDCYQVSDHLKDPTEPQIMAEIAALRPWIRFLQTKFQTIVYKLGNHEERLERFLMQKAPTLFGWQILSWDFLVNTDFTYDEHGKIMEVSFSKNPIKVVDNKRVIKAGSLSIVHGHEFGRQQVFNPVNPARGYFLRAKASVLGGDKHQTSEHVESDINGKIIGAWSTGCLCDLHPKYLPINRWNLGAAIVEHDGHDFEVDNFKIINGKVK